MFKLRDFFKSHPEILSLFMFLIGGFVVVYLTNNYFGVFAPFIISFVVIKVLRPIMVFFEKKLKLPNHTCEIIIIHVRLSTVNRNIIRTITALNRFYRMTIAIKT